MLGPIFVRSLDEQLVSVDGALQAEDRDRLEAAVAARAELLADRHRLLGERSVAEERARVATDSVPAAVMQVRLGGDVDSFRRDLAERLQRSLGAARVEHPRLRVLVTAADLKEADGQLLELNLTLTEDAVEWVAVQELGEDQRRLVPE